MAKTVNTPLQAADLAQFSEFGEIILEVGDSKNRYVTFAPTKSRLRGWWKKENLIGVSMNESLSQMPSLPGVYIVLDCRKRELRVYDPLTRSEFKEALEQARRVHKECFRTDAGPEKELKLENLDPTGLKTALYHVRRLLDNKQARLLSGQMPELEKILDLPGRTRVETWDSSARARKFLEEPEDEVAKRNYMRP